MNENEQVDQELAALVREEQSKIRSEMAGTGLPRMGVPIELARRGWFARASAAVKKFIRPKAVKRRPAAAAARREKAIRPRGEIR